MAANEHKNLENTQLHVPKDFSTAGVESYLTKDASSSINWRDIFQHTPVLDAVEGGDAPPTEASGDRYILLDITGTGSVHADWDGAAFDDIVEFMDVDVDGTAEQWVAYTPKEPDLTIATDPTIPVGYLFITSVGWQPFGLSNAPVGILHTDGSQDGNTAAATLQVVKTYTLPANTLLDNDSGLRIIIHGHFANNTDSKRVKFNFGSSDFDSGTLDFATYGTVVQDGMWWIEATVWRRSSTTQSFVVKFQAMSHQGGGVSEITQADQILGNSQVQAAETLSSDVTISVEVQSGVATANNITVEGWYIEKINKPV